MPDPGAIVDLDGTLVDSNYHHAIAWSRAFSDHDHDVPVASIHRLVGMGGSELVATLLGDSDSDIEAAWREHFDAMVPEVRAFPGAGDLLRALHDRGLTVVLATSSPPDLFDDLWSKVAADDAVDHKLTAGDVDAAKPEPDLFATAAETGNLDRDRAVAVGDSVWDVESAGKAGVACVGLEVGGFGRAELLDAGAVAVYRDPGDLAGRLDDSPFADL